MFPLLFSSNLFRVSAYVQSIDNIRSICGYITAQRLSCAHVYVCVNSTFCFVYLVSSLFSFLPHLLIIWYCGEQQQQLWADTCEVGSAAFRTLCFAKWQTQTAGREKNTIPTCFVRKEKTKKKRLSIIIVVKSHGNDLQEAKSKEVWLGWTLDNR